MKMLAKITEKLKECLATLEWESWLHAGFEFGASGLRSTSWHRAPQFGTDLLKVWWIDYAVHCGEMESRFVSSVKFRQPHVFVSAIAETRGLWNANLQLGPVKSYANFHVTRYIKSHLFCEVMRLKIWQTWLLVSTFIVCRLSTADTDPGSTWTLKFWTDSCSRNVYLYVRVF